jgi:hypothetical protein
MTDTPERTHGYEPPRVEGRVAIDGPLIGGAVSSNADTAQSAAFTHI